MRLTLLSSTVLALTLIGAVGAAMADSKANKTLVRDYMTMLFGDKQVATAVERYAAKDIVQHNPNLGDGADAVVEFLGTLVKDNPRFSYDIKRLIAEDDMVVVHAHVKFSPEDRGAPVVDIFRLADGKVAEHWDVLQPIPEQSANDNTMF